MDTARLPTFEYSIMLTLLPIADEEVCSFDRVLKLGNMFQDLTVCTYHRGVPVWMFLLSIAALVVAVAVVRPWQ